MGLCLYFQEILYRCSVWNAGKPPELMSDVKDLNPYPQAIFSLAGNWRVAKWAIQADSLVVPWGCHGWCVYIHPGKIYIAWGTSKSWSWLSGCVFMGVGNEGIETKDGTFVPSDGQSHERLDYSGQTFFGESFGALPLLSLLGFYMWNYETYSKWKGI